MTMSSYNVLLLANFLLFSHSKTHCFGFLPSYHSPRITPFLPLQSSSSTSSSDDSVTIVEQCYAAWNQRKIKDVVSCFDDKFSYDDGQYLGTITKKKELERYFRQNTSLVPRDAEIVLDQIAVCSDGGNSGDVEKIGARWHLERRGTRMDNQNTVVPYTNGCSFYTIDSQSGLIKTGFKVTEMIVKPDKRFSDALVSSASKFTMGTSSPKSNLLAKSQEGRSNLSIIESYFEAWNNRDMEAALACFVDNCTYQTEDPVFVDTFQGKDSLRQHLEKNAESLPPSCRILLDDVAIDSTGRGTFGVVWHLEVNGIAIPNLRGCSMYESDPETGLLTRGYDVTESPVKVPGPVKDVLTLPLQLFMN